MPSLSNSLVSSSASTSSCTSVSHSGDAPTSPPLSSSQSYSYTGSGSASSMWSTVNISCSSSVVSESRTGKLFNYFLIVVQCDYKLKWLLLSQ